MFLKVQSETNRLSVASENFQSIDCGAGFLVANGLHLHGLFTPHVCMETYSIWMCIYHGMSNMTIYIYISIFAGFSKNCT